MVLLPATGCKLWPSRYARCRCCDSAEKSSGNEDKISRRRPSTTSAQTRRRSEHSGVEREVICVKKNGRTDRMRILFSKQGHALLPLWHLPTSLILLFGGRDNFMRRCTTRCCRTGYGERCDDALWDEVHCHKWIPRIIEESIRSFGRTFTSGKVHASARRRSRWPRCDRGVHD